MTRSTERLHGNPQPDPGPVTPWRRVTATACWIVAIVFVYLSMPGAPI